MQENNTRHQDELTFKELVHAIGAIVGFLFTKKVYIILAVLLGAGIGGIMAYLKPVTYNAQISYMVNEETGDGGGLGSLLGQFGLGGGGAGDLNYDKILELCRSNRIIFSTILDSATVNGQNDLLGNHLIRQLELHEEWEDATDPSYANFYFQHTDRTRFTRTENAILKSLYYRIVGTPEQKDSEKILKASYSDVSRILYIAVRTGREDLSIALAKRIYAHLSDFYVSQSIEKQLATLTTVQAKVDSIATELRSAEYRLAQVQDRSLGLLQRSDQVVQDRLRRDVLVLSTMYAEALKNRETASFVLSNETPFLQVVDDVIPPLPPSKASKTRWILIGAFLGGFFSVLLFGGMKIVRDALA
ncbi:hypothetical protein QWY85_18595 [Neolewinella lacunae]|uniref:Polysaccharide chain length determinant N-terminal domain-containing protein n=1 Tax=Neolewinella lacunae TaxID=1517758 RepID=A0A923TCW0_9BACT|nr:hypothetical protein [Neolewinella lacunae]MBC6994167.1 hypothetical protein [Neolewinella lacunae]MDN3636684.1 hypothetical protein [Neolewinella lacunae]